MDKFQEIKEFVIKELDRLENIMNFNYRTIGLKFVYNEIKNIENREDSKSLLEAGY